MRAGAANKLFGRIIRGMPGCGRAGVDLFVGPSGDRVQFGFSHVAFRLATCVTAPWMLKTRTSIPTCLLHVDNVAY